VIILIVRPACLGGSFFTEFVTMESFSRQFQLNKEEKEAVGGDGTEKVGIPCFMWSMLIPELPSLRNCLLSQVIVSRKWEERYWRWFSKRWC
jgi:hypothetical protein